jgi:hypothetical protein
VYLAADRVEVVWTLAGEVRSLRQPPLDEFIASLLGR